MNSALYTGNVVHRRFSERLHSFRYRIHLMLLDLDELEDVFSSRWLWSNGRPNLVSFQRRDYLGASDTPLAEAVLQRASKSGALP